MEANFTSVNPTSCVANLRGIDREILGVLELDGRATPRYLSRQLGEQQSYVSQRLTFLVDEVDLVERVDRGLYEIDCEVVVDG